MEMVNNIQEGAFANVCNETWNKITKLTEPSEIPVKEKLFLPPDSL